jgi:hypothetical protein
LDGDYEALLWDGTSDDAFDGTLSVEDGVASPTGHFFAISDPATIARTYEISKISFSAEGVITVEAFHHPTDEKWGVSSMAVNWTTYETDENWTIIL